ncbi:hypothetical protein Asppvi_001910 [Aspergillus pseudoviridinutans]|uniref:DRBM domain-containing protein n=1 Tax=Aspergillus pseudoviridinutans TaxID=1517512 RepID=A0A9P3F0L4_9EURO|nr:uncharacterized protein Asppvi_001910 [Aspergillus pseudoviridinutans]GIJ92632.1 hypothetical protein Asppvi_001910 [Aspergillus pseudoviridinutans]
MSPRLVQPDCYTNTDYEIGKRLFNVYMALMMVQSSPGGRTGESLVEADRFIESKAFNFEAAMAAIKGLNLDLPRTDIINDESVEDYIYKILGFVRLANNREDFILLLAKLQLQIPTCSADTGISATAYQQSTLEERAGRYISLAPTQCSSNSNQGPEIWKYTSLLWEEAVNHGVTPDIKETCLSSYPPKFRITISCMGAQSSGEGKTKKLAKHIAAKGICQKLGLQPC